MTMGELIKFHREKLNLSQEELGSRLIPKVQKAAINKWEKGTVENIKRTHIEQMSNMFGISPYKLMAFDDVEPASEPPEILKIFELLNSAGRQRVLEYAELLSRSEEYQKKEFAVDRVG